MSAAKFTLYTFVPRGFSASYAYRILTNLETARDLGLPWQCQVDTNDAGINVEDRVRAFMSSDITLLYQPVGEGTVQNVRQALSHLPSLVDGAWKYPPSVIVDTDDNLFNVSPHNSAFKNLGIRDMDGNLIPPTVNGKPTVIGCTEGGERRALWTQGENGFNLLDNRNTLDGYRSIIEMSDCVTCSTPPVEREIKANTHAARTKVLPNLVRFDHYEQVDLQQDQTLRILWQGGGAHYEDWYPLRQALGNIVKKYPHVHFLIWGVLYHWVTELMPPERYTFINWCDYKEYKLRLAMKNHDISLAPLQSNRFNDSRSAIKFYEACVLKKDIPTLAENTGAYKAEIIDGETGLLYDGPEEFELKLSGLIEDATLRKTLGQNAKDWVHQHRDAMREVPKVFAWYEHLRDVKKLEQPRMPDSEWEKFVEAMNSPPADQQVQTTTV